MTKAALFAARQNEPCPECGAELVIRSGRHGPFLGCSQYPDCQYIRPLKAQADGHIVKVLEGQECPKCQATLVLRQGRYGMFIGCSHYPECDHTEVIDKPDETSITCPQCGRANCCSVNHAMAKFFTPAIAIQNASLLLTTNPSPGNVPIAIIRC
ncbi:DNA topoisomerase 1 [Serratia rubidaea]|uniref:DNA topoisomerase 1 n=1 Tax=Serratia rubidaea TaxID=61652 RepID=A0A447QKK4_SERRU|nr:DNA topoisomerase 1 [Serratia rubidaea]